MSVRRTRLLPLGVLGVAVFAIGVAAAMMRLPDWRNRRVPEPARFAEELRQVAGPSGLALESQPRIALRSRGWLPTTNSENEYELAYDVLGKGTADWLAREGRGPFVMTAARSRWLAGGDTGELRVLFSLRGVPLSAQWTPDDPFRRSARNVDADGRRKALVRMLLPRDAPLLESEIIALGEPARLAAVPGTQPPEVVLSTPTSREVTPNARRIAGSVATWHKVLESLTIGSIFFSHLPALVVISVFYLGTLGVFLMLLARRRIELTKGAVLGVASVVLSLAEPFRASGTWIQLVNPLIAIVMKGLALFVLWAAAESWLRSTVPNFRTSLDALRAGRLGPAGGRALLAGWSIGAMAAGLWLLALAVGTLLPGVGPTAGSVHVPIFSAEASPIDEGAIRTGIVLLAICAGMRLPVVRRVRGSATVLTALGLTCRLALTSFWFSCVVGLILGIVLVRAYTHFGLTALLAAALTSTVLPAALFSLLHFSWLTSSALLLLATAAAPLVFGSIGIRRPEGVEDGPYTLPAFVRRLEEENRVKYEMELLAKMQLGLLPRETPRVDGYEIAARSILATEAGGDLYDFVHDANGRIWIAAGDVSGHGYSCAIAQAMTKAGLASLVEAERTPAVVLDRLDRVLRGMGAPRTFTSLALLRLDPPSGEVLLSNAGHPYPWLASANGETRELELPSLPLGQGPPRQYADTPLTIDSGSVLVLSSDGLFEGTDANGHAYGFERIREVLAKVSRRPAEAILAAIIDDWRAHVGAAAPADDTTVVVVKRK